MKKLPTAQGPARDQRLLRVVDADVVELRARGEAALGRHDVDQVARLVGRQGRVAEGHGDHARRLRPRRDRHPPPADRRAAARRACNRRARRERRRRQAPASDAGAARPLHDARGARPARGAARRDRRRRPALAGRALADPGARARWARTSRSSARRRCCRAGSRRWAARRPRTSARSRGADVVYVLRMQRERMQEGANYVPSPARVHRALGRHARAAAARARR